MNLLVFLGIWIQRFALNLMLYFLYEILLRFDRNGEIQLIGELLVKFNCHDCNFNDDWLDFGLTYD